MCFGADTAIVWADGTSIREITPCFEHAAGDQYSDALEEADLGTEQNKNYLARCPHPGCFRGEPIPRYIILKQGTRSDQNHASVIEDLKGNATKRMKLLVNYANLVAHDWITEEETDYEITEGTKKKRKRAHSFSTRFVRMIKMYGHPPDDCAEALGKDFYDHFVKECIRTHIDDEEAFAISRGKTGLLSPPAVDKRPSGENRTDKTSTKQASERETESSKSSGMASDANSDVSGDREWAEELIAEGSRFDVFGDVADAEDFDWPQMRPDGMYDIPAIFKMS